MPRDMMDDDWQQRMLVLALIQAQDDFRGVCEDDLNKQVPRYLRELTKLGVNHPPFYQDIVLKTYSEVFDGFVYAMSCDVLIGSVGNNRFKKHVDPTRLITSGIYISPEYGRLALEAARVTASKFRSHDLDDDRTETEKVKTTTQ